MDDFEHTLVGLFEAACRAEPDRAWLSFDDAPGEGRRTLTLSETAARVETLAGVLAETGVAAGDRVATQLDNTPDYVTAILALARLGAVWLPLDRRAPAATLAAKIARARPAAALAHAPYRDGLEAAGLGGPIVDPSAPATPLAAAPIAPRRPDDWRAIMFTSGTTGMPKGVIVTERMFCAAGRFAAAAGKAGPGETFLLWEPLNHIGGAQMIPAALVSGASLAMVPKFSASTFWRQAKEAGATRLHYLGGVLDLLAKQPPAGSDRDHRVTHGFGAAARPEMWRLFPERFGVTLTEVYGQTEASSFCVTNGRGVPGAVGRPLPPFDIALIGTDGAPVKDGGTGQIAIAATPPGLLTPGYLDDPEATNAAFRNGRFLTGDLARRDKDGNLIFAGRVKDVIRHRGENVSALEVETAISAHPAVADCAALGVAAEIGEEDILVVAELCPGATLAPPDLLAWLGDRLAPFQLPRYVTIVDRLPRTPSERVAKAEIPRDVAGAWDAEKYR